MVGEALNEEIIPPKRLCEIAPIIFLFPLIATWGAEFCELLWHIRLVDRCRGGKESGFSKPCTHYLEGSIPSRSELFYLRLIN